jgi:hypothetical protein
MRRLSLSVVAALLIAGSVSAQCSNPGPYVQQFGNPLLPIINVVSGDFTMGANTTVRFQAGLAFIEGFACLVIQEHTDNLSFILQVPGIAGDLYICINRPFFSYFEGQLLGGLNAGNSPLRTFNVPFDPQLCGFQFGSQGYVTTEQFGNPTFSQYLVGTLH